MSGYVIGVDIGGTFTDCVVIGQDGTVTIGKSASTSFALSESGAGRPHELEPSGHRDVIWYELGGQPRSTPVYRGGQLSAGAGVSDPAIVEFVDTTLVLRHGRRAMVDAWNNIVIET